MGKAIEKRETHLPAEVSDLMSGLANMTNVARSDGSADSGSFMKFKKGTYLYGVDGIEPEKGSLWAVNPNSFAHGFQAWGDGELLGEETAAMRDALVQKSILPTYEYKHPETGTMVDAKWQPYRGFELACTNGDDEGTGCRLGGTSMGMTKAINKLIAALIEHLKEDASTPVPIIKLESDSYEHNKYGEIFFPVFEVVEWLGMDATEVSEPDEGQDGEDGEDENPGDSREEAEAEAAEAEAVEAEAAEKTKAEAEKPGRKRRRRN